MKLLAPTLRWTGGKQAAKSLVVSGGGQDWMERAEAAGQKNAKAYLQFLQRKK